MIKSQSIHGTGKATLAIIEQRQSTTTCSRLIPSLVVNWPRQTVFTIPRVPFVDVKDDRQRCSCRYLVLCSVFWLPDVIFSNQTEERSWLCRTGIVTRWLARTRGNVRFHHFIPFLQFLSHFSIPLLFAFA